MSVVPSREARLSVKEIKDDERLLAFAASLVGLGLGKSGFWSNLGQHFSAVTPAIELPQTKLADCLKIAEYAFLVAPISQSVQSYIDHPGLLPPPKDTKASVKWFVGTIGEYLSSGVMSRLKQDSDRFRVLERIAQERASLASTGLAPAVAPLSETVRSAAISSVNNMYSAAVVNALTIQRALGDTITHQELVDATRSSHRLALARPLVHLNDQPAVSNMIDDYLFSILNGSQPNPAILLYNSVNGRVEFGATLKSFLDVPKSISQDERDDGVKIGCPLSFSPKLVTSYYQTVTDQIEEYDLWPTNLWPVVNDPYRDTGLAALLFAIPE